MKCNGFHWFSFALSAHACLRTISLKFRHCSIITCCHNMGLTLCNKLRCSKNAFWEEPDYLADCTVRDAMVVPPCFRLFASAPPPDRKAMPLRDVYLHRRYAWGVSRENVRGFCKLGTSARSPMLSMKKQMHVFACSICNVACIRMFDMQCGLCRLILIAGNVATCGNHD